MILATRPELGAGYTPLVSVKLGECVATLTAEQAEEVAQSLMRAATAARYEAAVHEGCKCRDEEAATKMVKKMRGLVERKRIARS